MRKKKKGRVPEVLWRLYGKQARSLAETVVSMLPPPPATAEECRCKGKHCLGCSGTDAMSFLLRPSDPSDYHNLLNRCFAVLPENAPPLAVFYPDCRWSQPEIVKRTIEMIMCDPHMSHNVICNGYNKCAHSSDVVDLLISSAWCLLLRRIGDDAMVHLLKFASIFLPLPHENHHQVAGSSISNFVSRLSKRKAGTVHQWTLPFPSEPPNKRKRTNVVDNFNLGGNVSSQHSLGFDFSLGSFNCTDGCKLRNIIGRHRPHWTSKKERSFSEEIVLSSCTVKDSNEKNLNEEFQQRLIEGKECRKRLRPSSWQRRKCKKVNVGKDNVITSCITTSSIKENIPSKLQESSSTSLSSLPEKKQGQCWYAIHQYGN